MKKLILFLFLPFNLLAQNFNRTYGEDSILAVGIKAFETQNGKYKNLWESKNKITGKDFTFGFNYLDEKGNVEKSKIFKDSTMGFHFYEAGKLKDEGTLAYGYAQEYYPNDSIGYSKPFVVRFDNNEDTIWTKIINIPNFPGGDFESFVEYENGNIILSGVYYNFNGSFFNLTVKIDSLGKILWMKSLGNQNKKIAGRKLIKLNNNKIINLGYTLDKANPSAILFDSSGNLIKEKIFTKLGNYYESKFNTGFQSKNGLIYAGGLCKVGNFTVYDTYPVFFCLDTALNLVFFKKYFTGQMTGYFYDMAERENGGIICQGVVAYWNKDSSERLGHTHMINLNYNGDSIWSRFYNGDNFEYYGECLTLTLTKDNGILLCGTSYSQSEFVQKSWVVKTDSIGCDMENCKTEIGNEFPDINKQLIVFPNPTNGLVNWKINYFENFNLTLSIFDLQGKEIFSINNLGPEGKADLLSIKKGSYLMVLKDKDRIIGRKIILLN